MKQIVKVLALTLTCALTAGVFGGCLIGGGKSQNAANGNLSSYGLVASSDKYTFIAQSSNDYSGDGNGSFSCTNIYRVSNKKQDDPVVIYSEPAAVRYGNPGGISVAFMTYAYGRLYFLTMQDTGMEIHWISDDGKKSGTVDLDLGRYLRRTPVSDGSGYYIYCPDADYTVTADSEDYSYVNAYCWYRVDMKTGKAAKFRPAFLEENELAMYITSADGYLYFIKGYPDTETMDKGIYRAKSGDKRAEGIVEADPDLLEDVDFMLACGNDLWFMGNHELHYVDISTGKDTLLGDDLRESPLNTSGDGLVWHSDYDGRIVRTDKEGHTEVVYSADPDKEAVISWRGHANVFFTNWLNYVYQGTPFDLDELEDLEW